MQVGRQWFTIGMGLCTIFCTVALAPAAERPTMIVVGGNDGMLHKANGLGSASQSSVPDTGAGVRGQSLAQASDVTEEQDPLAPDPRISSTTPPARLLGCQASGVRQVVRGIM
jgi:hypothetical protein